MLLEDLQWHHVEGALMGACQHHRCAAAVFMGTQPVERGDTPPVPRDQSGEAELRHRGTQIIADRPLVLEELGGDHRADGVQAAVLIAGRAAAIPIEPGHRVGAAGVQRFAEDVEISHLASIGHARRRCTPLRFAGQDLDDRAPAVVQGAFVNFPYRLGGELEFQAGQLNA